MKASHYVVTWSVDIFDATNVVDAAQKARTKMLHPGAAATVFHVRERQGSRTALVDLSEPPGTRVTREPAPRCRHDTCRYCGLDIEGLAPFKRGEWRDRGNNTHCPGPKPRQHAPYPIGVRER